MVPLVLAVVAGFSGPAPLPPPSRAAARLAAANDPQPTAPDRSALPVNDRPAAAVPQNLGEHAAAVSQPYCPGDVAQPFRRLPRVCPVPSCLCAPELLGMSQHEDRGHVHPPQPGDPPAPKVAFVKVFDQAASIPLPRFTAAGCPVPTDGLVIYEGMRLVVYYDGGYELSFTATVPDMLTVLRLQLVFAPDGQPDGPYAQRITLPPIRMAPAKDHLPGKVEGATFHVSHRGYSSLFAAGNTGNWAEAALYRVGTARFGSPVALEDPNQY